VGIPGTGLFYTTTFSSGKTGKKGALPSPAPTIPPEDRLTLGFFKRLVTPDDEEALVDGCRELAAGNEERALEHLRKAVHLADGAYLAGFLALKAGRLNEGAADLEEAARSQERLGHYFTRYGISAVLGLPVTEEIIVHVGPDLRGVLLGLVEVYQRQARWKDAIACLERLRQLEPGDEVIKLSLAEFLLTLHPDDRETCQRVVRLTEGIENETPLHAAMLLYKARALRGLGLLNAARETLTDALRRKKHRPVALLHALRYERALVYGDLGQRARERRDLERLYAEDPDYEDVASRLGL